jgi:transposase
MLKLKREKNPGEKWWKYKKGRGKKAAVNDPNVKSLLCDVPTNKLIQFFGSLS